LSSCFQIQTEIQSYVINHQIFELYHANRTANSETINTYHSFSTITVLYRSNDRARSLETLSFLVSQHRSTVGKICVAYQLLYAVILWICEDRFWTQALLHRWEFRSRPAQWGWAGLGESDECMDWEMRWLWEVSSMEEGTVF